MEKLVSEITRRKSYTWSYEDDEAFTVSKVLLKNIYENGDIDFSVEEEFFYKLDYNRIDLNESKEEIIDFIECYGERIYKDPFNKEDFDNVHDALKYYNKIN